MHVLHAHVSNTSQTSHLGPSHKANATGREVSGLQVPCSVLVLGGKQCFTCKCQNKSYRLERATSLFHFTSVPQAYIYFLKFCVFNVSFCKAQKKKSWLVSFQFNSV